MSNDLPNGSIAITELVAWLDDGQELAFIDVREEGLYGEDHPLLAVNTPYSVLEEAFPPLVPRLATRVVLYGETNAQSEQAASWLALAGYSQVHILDGGIDAWRAHGLALFKGVNVPSKAFAECVEHSLHTPAIHSDELQHLIDQRADYVLLDSRTVEEYERFHVPTAVAVPSAELIYRFTDLVPSPDTLVVITCAGRTRGVVGAQALINAGVPNKVVALAGGAQGWRLAGYQTVSDDCRYFGPVSEQAVATAQVRAARLAERFGVAVISAATLEEWQADPERTTYVFDVRNADEYEAGHRWDARWVPGGQLVQAIDKVAATRNARVVLNDDNGVRAISTAHWLRQLGWDAVVLVGVGEETKPLRPAAISFAVPTVDAPQAKRLLDDGAVALSAQRSGDYRQSHPEGAQWVNRARLHDVIGGLPVDAKVVVFAAEAALAAGVTRDLLAAGIVAVAVVGGDDQWAAAGIELQGSASPQDADRIDFLFWLHDRVTGSGNLTSSAAYIAWEEDLPRQIGDHANGRFRIHA